MTQQGGSGRPAVAVISSHVARGSVGNRAAVFALESLGFPVWAVTTVSLPWHPGHGPAPRIVPDDREFAAYMQALASSPHLLEVGAVLTGYLGSPEQAEAIAGFIAAARRVNPNLLHVCDPVIGDRSGLYVSEAVAEEIRDRLFTRADLVTPNRFELEWLTGRNLDTNDAIAAAASSLDAPTALVTSAHPLLAGGTGNLLIDHGKAVFAEHRFIEDAPNGPGDLTAALFLGRILMGASPEKALQLATASVFEMVSRTCKRGADELMLETDSTSMLKPMAMVQMRHMALSPSPPQRA
ncbi:pyridoxal kinase PdxY [Oricola cellulosilytica]|uniref:pyridoxal kinase n=1 Tax=Oricola cellulosilytica TaxID=1429082 RepID=A0A4R0PBY3_9HYPH|nr:pyridoxal kinase PdxY [Oricola cellulosilytica]TCD13857.1 pyridoxal kinase PdxY [Oricola cellulosilytica]